MDVFATHIYGLPTPDAAHSLAGLIVLVIGLLLPAALGFRNRPRR